MEIIIYYTFKEFEKNYKDDLKKWFDTYPDANEKDFRTESKKKYAEYYYHNDTNFDKILNYIELPIFKDYDFPFGYLNSSDPISLQELFKIITDRFNNFFDSKDEISKNKENYIILINSNFVFDYIDDNGFPQPRANIFSDKYFIAKKDFDLYLPFAKVEYHDFLESGDIELDSIKFKNFEYSTRRIMNYLNSDEKIKTEHERLNNDLNEIHTKYEKINIKNQAPKESRDTDEKTQNTYSVPQIIKILDKLNIKGMMGEKGFTDFQTVQLLADIFGRSEKSIRNNFDSDTHKNTAENYISDLKNLKAKR